MGNRTDNQQELDLLNKSMNHIKIHGISEIIHSIRVKLKLSMEEYVFILFIEQHLFDKKTLTFTDVYLSTGIEKDAAKSLIMILRGKNFLVQEHGRITGVTNLWKNEFKISKTEFEKWFKDGELKWTGSKKKGQELYKKARKKHSFNEMFEYRDNYFKLLKITKERKSFNRQIMSVERFLGPTNELYLSNWIEQIDEIIKEYPLEENNNVIVSTTSIADAKNLFT